MRRYLAPRWLLGHLLVAAVAVTFLRLGWWQWVHARQGNTLSYGYALQWPLFAAFGVFFWIRVLRERVARAVPPTVPSGEVDDQVLPAAQPDHRQATVGVVWSFRTDLVPGVADDIATPAVAAGDDRNDRLAAYNEMLAWLNADPTRRHADYRHATLDNHPTG